MMLKNRILLMSTLIVLSGCSSSHTSPPPKILKGTVSQLETGGAQVIQQGDRLTIVIPTDRYFESTTTTIKPNRQKDLQDIARFVKNFSNNYPHSMIRVTGYTDQVFAHKTQLDLSQGYAETVRAYLFNAGINPRRIAAEGRGSSEPIAGQFAPSSAALNRRVLIQVN